MAKFKEKSFGILADTLRGAGYGAAVGAAAGGGLTRFVLRNNKSKEIKLPLKKEKVTLDDFSGETAGALVGATLGAFAAAIKSAANAINRKRTVNKRLMNEVVEILTSEGHKEGMSFTRDPRRADLMKSKVSIVVYKYSDELRIVVNSLDDPKLAKINEEITEKVGRSTDSFFREEVSGKYKDISITAVSNPSADARYVAWVAHMFITKGFPVYLVEVG